MAGQSAEVRGDCGVRGGGEEEAAESEGVIGEEERRSCVWVVESVESGDDKDYDEEERTERRRLAEREYRGCGVGRSSCCERLRHCRGEREREK